MEKALQKKQWEAGGGGGWGVIQGQIMESQAMKAGFYLVGNGESLPVYEMGSHVIRLIQEQHKSWQSKHTNQTISAHEKKHKAIFEVQGEGPQETELE